METSNTNVQETIVLYSNLSLSEILDNPVYLLISSNPTHSYIYLKFLNSQRANLLSMKHDIFEQMVIIFSGILITIQKTLLINRIEHSDDGQNIQCYQILDLVIVLSQTFYKQSDKEHKREMLMERIKGHCIWKDGMIWKKVIDYLVAKKVEKQREMIEKGDGKKNVKEVMVDKERMIVKNTLITFKYHLMNFGVGFLEKEVLGGFIEKYHLYDINAIDFS